MIGMVMRYVKKYKRILSKYECACSVYVLRYAVACHKCRKFMIIDWCIFNANAYGVLLYERKIGIITNNYITEKQAILLRSSLPCL